MRLERGGACIGERRNANNLVRFQVLTAASMKFRFAFWDVLPCKIIADRCFRGMGQHVPLKRRSTIILHGSTSQKTNLN
jgi:hypothetical protein